MDIIIDIDEVIEETHSYKFKYRIGKLRKLRGFSVPKKDVTNYMSTNAEFYTNGVREGEAEEILRESLEKDVSTNKYITAYLLYFHDI